MPVGRDARELAARIGAVLEDGDGWPWPGDDGREAALEELLDIGAFEAAVLGLTAGEMASVVAELRPWLREQQGEDGDDTLCLVMDTWFEESPARPSGEEWALVVPEDMRDRYGMAG